MTKKKKHSNAEKNVPLKAMSWIAGAVLLAGLGIIAGLYLDQNTRISGVEFRQNYFTAEQDLLDAMESPEGMLADSVNVAGIFNSLRTLPYVDDVSLSMNRRGVLTFTVTEHQPLAMLVNGSTRSYVSESGIKLPLISGKAVDVPLVYGFPANPAGDTLSTDAFRQVSDFLKSAKENEFGWITISEVTWNEREGVVALSHENGVRLVFGHEQFRQRLENWEAFYGEVVSKKGIGSFNRVDLRFRNQIVTR